ncbi:D-glycero-alpha-D-manno-heptose-1,7-bisphosphate 7-phosphatase [Desulfobacterium sp. N47]|uniref:D,D-heptose 1,7-bisphosphate phosphatase n=1 Tax=uncultured Desulfobacterium sp. TaxID=201089 RepID=E1YF43_9BACT|nr:D,D-heptose 1,7-bisphosphate phosphatase [uncultured Desulfobacterium sp.]
MHKSYGADKTYVFLDRDGVINKDSPDYIKTWSEFEFIPGSIEAIKCLSENNYHVIVITNQSMINRKISTSGHLEYIHAMMNKAVQNEGGEIKDIFFCPHSPEEACTCRKPKPGLIHQAVKKYKINIAESVMVGDSAKDIECAKRAGCKYTILVKTGNYIKAISFLEEKKMLPDYVAADLLDAVRWIMKYGRAGS